MTRIPIRPIILRIIFFLALAAGLGAVGLTAVRTAIGDSIMVFIQRNPRLSLEGKTQGADMAVRFSPRDPSVHWLRGGVYFNAANEDFTEEHLKTAVSELRQAVKMSPEDYRIWLSLGRVLDRTDNLTEARSAFETALRLAPRHFEPRWAMGNHLLRAGDREGSFEQMRLALAGRPSALPLIFDYAWDAYEGDGKAIAGALDPPAGIKSQLISMLIARNKVDDAMAVWSEIASPAVKDVQRVTEALVNAGRFGLAYRIWSKGNIPERPEPDADSLLSNGSFERAVTANTKIPFYSWRIAPGGGVRSTLDRSGPKEGYQSLRVSLEVRENIPITLASQTVPVKPEKRYCLSFFMRSEGLRSLSNPFVEIFDSADIQRARAATESFPIDSIKWSGDFEYAANEREGEKKNTGPKWNEYEISLMTAPQTEALTVRLYRQPCGMAPCPIEGRVWFDQLRLYECQGPRKIESPRSMTNDKW